MAAIHSLNRFAITVPALDAAAQFFRAFGLDVRSAVEHLDLQAFGDPHCWGRVHLAPAAPKRLAYVSYGVSAEEAVQLAKKAAPYRADPHPLGGHEGLWLCDPDGVATQVLVAPQLAPSAIAPGPVRGPAPGRRQMAAVRPRRLSHLLRFTQDVARMVRFCSEVLGLRLSDRSRDAIAFMHSPHGSDHHLVAFARSPGPGLHHTSWTVGSIDEVGWGAEQMKAAGYARGWGVGRHVLGSNYFYYAQDPWGSFAEYSFGIDFIPAGSEWRAGDHPPEDSFYLWGPCPPDDFARNGEIGV